MTDDLMKDDKPQQEEQLDPNKDYLQELVGPGRKFRDEKELAKGKFESDSYIKVLERRLDEMRNDYLSMKNESVTSKRLEELIAQLSDKKSPSSEEPERKEEHQPMFDPKQIDSLVSSKIQEHELSRQQTTNFNTVRDRLKERYGANYKQRLQEQIEDLGITEQDLNDMARRQPKVLLRTLGLDKTTASDVYQAPPTSSQRSDSAQGNTPDRTWSYYQGLKEKDPKIYFDRKTAVQMQEDAIRLGDKFYDGNFYVKGLHERN